MMNTKAKVNTISIEGQVKTIKVKSRLNTNEHLGSI